MNRREFIGGFGGLVAVSALPGCRTGKNITFGERGGFERLNLAYTHIEAGATEYVTGGNFMFHAREVLFT